MTYQRDPNDPATNRRTRMGMRDSDGSWGVFPVVLGVIFLLLVGLIAYNMYAADTPETANPSAQAPVTNPSGTGTSPPATTPPTTTPPANAPATPPTVPPAKNQ